ncbi:MAG: putative ABC transporter permease [Eubacteriales bacterium]|nr:putative ABC transporter permease [Eubacteriales bacterium]
MIFGMTYYQALWFFLIYSFGGWVVEVAFHAVKCGKAINRGFLSGPVCPVYGFGVMSVFAFFDFLKSITGIEPDALGIFLGGVVLATFIELIAGWALDICFHARWWDYTDMPFNFRGYICLAFSIIWGFAILLVVKILHPFIAFQLEKIMKPSYGWFVAAFLYIVYFTDTCLTVAIIRGFNKKLRQLDTLQADILKISDSLTETVSKNTIKAAQTVGESRVQMALAKAELRDSAAEAKKSLETTAATAKTTLETTAATAKSTLEATASNARTTIGTTAANAKTVLETTAATAKTTIETTAVTAKTALGEGAASRKQAITDAASDWKQYTEEELRRKKEELLKKREELTSGIVKSKLVGRILKAFPEMKHDYYQKMIDAIRERISKNGD